MIGYQWKIMTYFIDSIKYRYYSEFLSACQDSVNVFTICYLLRLEVVDFWTNNILVYC
jgi:hypothetical protein